MNTASRIKEKMDWRRSTLISDDGFVGKSYAGKIDTRGTHQQAAGTVRT
jgi:hypothetical protein